MKTRQECEKILGAELVLAVEQTLISKGINKMTFDRVIDYLALHKQAFPYFDIVALSKNLCENLNGSITFNNLTTSVKYLFKDNAYGFARGGDIFINTKPLKCVLPPKQYNVMVDSLIRHELDHIATTRTMKLDKETYKKVVARNIRAKESLFGEIDVPQGEDFGDYINRLADSQFSCYMIVDGHKKLVEADRVVYKRCGVRGTQGDTQVKHFMGSRALNEGITAYKMKIMDKFAGQSGLMCQSGYILGEEVAGHIAKTIGKEEFIARQIAGDFVGMAERYKEKTGKDTKQMRRIFKVLDSNRHNSLLDKIFSQINYTKSNCMDKSTQQKYDLITKNNINENC